MDRMLIAAMVVGIAVAVAAALDARRRRDAPTQPQWAVPVQLDRADFDRPDAPWLVVLFTSATCDTCAGAVDKARVLEADDVVVHEVEVTTRPDLHTRYGIDAVPTLVVAGADGAVRLSYVGPPPAAELWAEVARLREGSA